jgi:hypothetical protein
MADRVAVPLDFKPTTPEELERCLADPMWRLCSGQLYKIMVKEGEGEDNTIVPFHPNRSQRRFLSRLWHRNIILKARQLGFCVDPSTRVLTAGLEWVPIGEIQPGTEVVAVDEHPPGGKGSSRKMRTATVQAVRTMQTERFRITFDDGRSVVCTDRHPWLSRKTGTDARWRSLSGEGNEVTGRLKIGTQVRWITKPWNSPTVEDGWFGGMLDGEGSMALPSRTGASVNVSQRPGPVWDRLEKYALARGYHARIEADEHQRDSKHGTTPVPKLTFTRMDELFRLMGQTRPTRFIDRRWWEGRELPGKRNGDVGWATITSIEPLGMGEVVDMQTSTGTYIAEGFVSHNTTLVCLMFLDHAMFNPNQRCGIVAQDKEAAEEFFRDKVLVAYDNLPDEIKERIPLARRRAAALEFGNNSSIRVGVSLRSGTFHRLHISEYGKTSAKFPDKAKEIKLGTLPTCPLHGIAIIESTAEGQEGEFYKMTSKAMEIADTGRLLTPKDFRFHFFPWWQEAGYRLTADDAKLVAITAKEHKYFDDVEVVMRTRLDLGQRAWYIATRESEFGGDPEDMWQEYPSTPTEAFQVSTEGFYYAIQLAQTRQAGRIGHFPFIAGYPVNTFWDIGGSDGTGIWLHQNINTLDRFFKYVEDWEKPYGHYVAELQRIAAEHGGFVWGTHYLPHDADHERPQGKTIEAPIDMLQALNLGGTWQVLERVEDLQHGIQLTRNAFSHSAFDEAGTKEGLVHLAGYKKRWDRANGRWSDQPAKNEHREAADAYRQFAQGYAAPAYDEQEERRSRRARNRNWKTA